MAGRRLVAACLLAVAAQCARAQDVLRLESPNGKLEFRLVIGQPEPEGLLHLAYQLRLDGRPVLDTSYLGIDVHLQEPMLGENVGFSRAMRSQGPGYRAVIAEYLQNGTVGRRLNVEARAYDDGVAFRYTIPATVPLDELLIEDELTEFSFVKPVETAGPVALPFVMEEPGAGWVGIYEAGAAAYPRATLVRDDPTTMITQLVQKERVPRIAYESHTPFTGPWRIVAIAPDRAGLAKTQVVRDLVRP